MSHSKSCLFQYEERNFSSFCKALAHPARRRIFDMLIAEQTIPFETICKSVPLHPATIQDHLNKLRLAHLLHVDLDDDGDLIGYRLNYRTKRKMDRLFRRFTDQEGAKRVA